MKRQRKISGTLGWNTEKYRRWFRRKLHRLYLKRVRMVEREIGEDLAVC